MDCNLDSLSNLLFLRFWKLNSNVENIFGSVEGAGESSTVAIGRIGWLQLGLSAKILSVSPSVHVLSDVGSSEHDGFSCSCR